MNTIAVDAMGGDNAPSAEVHGAIEAVREAAVEVVLVGRKEAIAAELASAGASSEARIAIEDAADVVTMEDHPGRVYKQKPNSSLRRAMELVKSGRAKGMISAGNSGATLSHALFTIGRFPGVERPGIATVLPTRAGTLTLCDSGANVDVKPEILAQFAILAAQFDRALHGHERPSVGLLSNGAEASKGTALTRAADELLRQCGADAGMRYVGYVEASSLFAGDIDVIATDGFTGNVVLKLAEGVSEMILEMVGERLQTSVRAKMGAPLVKPALSKLKQLVHYSETGAAMLLGVRELVMIAHGRSDATAVKNAIKLADRFATTGLISDLAATVERHHRVLNGKRKAAP